MSATLQASPALAEALRLADLGYAVFPVLPGRKNPACKHGVNDATNDAEQIQRWWAAKPDLNIGLATAGLIVIDLECQTKWESGRNVWQRDHGRASA